MAPMAHVLIGVLAQLALATDDLDPASPKKYRPVGETDQCGVSVDDFKSLKSNSANSFAEKSQWVDHDTIEPIIYLHIPKCGSGFANALVHFACGKKVASNLTLVGPNVKNKGGTGLATKFWNEKCGDNRFLRFEAGHAPLWKDMSKHTLSKVVMMVRPPKERITSGYLHNLHDCSPLQQKYGISWQNDKRWKLDGEIDPTTFKEYAACVDSCTTNMLVGKSCGYDGQGSKPTYLRKALERLPQLGFVGLTDHWEMSICLWHAKFGGECLPAEFVNVRPGPHRAQYDEKSLGASSQWNDQAIYDKAADLFVKDLEKHDVNPHTCATKYCPAVAHLFGKEDSSSSVRTNSSGALMLSTTESLKTLMWPGRSFYDED
jgi:hypothetical protein